MNKKGLFVVFEGLDFTGKSTIIEKLKLKKPNYIYTREPGGNECELSENIRQFILSYPQKINVLTEAYLFAASRVEHVNKIKEWIDKGNIVICDRYVYSSMCYQGIIKKLGVSKVEKINKYAINKLKPDLVFYITVSKDERDKRILSRKNINIFDEQTININYKRINYEYYSLIKYKVRNVITIDTTNNDDYTDIIIENINKLN